MNLLHVFVFVQNFHEPQHLFGRSLFQCNRILRDEIQFGKRALDFRVAQRFFNGLKIVRAR